MTRFGIRMSSNETSRTPKYRRARFQTSDIIFTVRRMGLFSPLTSQYCSGAIIRTKLGDDVFHRSGRLCMRCAFVPRGINSSISPCKLRTFLGGVVQQFTAVHTRTEINIPCSSHFQKHFICSKDIFSYSISNNRRF